MAREPGMHHEFVLIDQSQLRQRQRELHACHEQPLARLPLELLNGLPQIPAHELRVPIDPVQGGRHDVLLCRVDRPGEGFHPIRPRSRPRRRPPRCLHHFVSHPAEEEGIGLVEVLDRVTMQVFVRGDCTMIAAPVQCDVDGIPKGSHYARVLPMGRPSSHEHFLNTRRVERICSTFGHGPARISTYPSVPFTRIRCPSRISRVACSTPTTAGKPYSRAITAPWVIRPPTSVTRPLIATNRGVQLGSV